MHSLLPIQTQKRGDMPTEEELLLLFTTALPISKIDQLVYPGASTALIWVDLADRPDLGVLAEQGDLNQDKLFICTWFYVMPATPMMGIGLRVKMHTPPHLAFSLVFPLKHDYEQLVTMSQEGSFWVLPSPAPEDLGNMLVGDDVGGFFERVATRCGQGLFVELSPDLVEDLRKQLSSWAAQYKKPQTKRRAKRKKKKN
jgi:hypothetical protein